MPSIKIRVKGQKNNTMREDMVKAEVQGTTMMSYGWFVKLSTFISTSKKCTCVPTQGTEVSVCLWALLFQAWVRGERSGLAEV